MVRVAFCVVWLSLTQAVHQLDTTTSMMAAGVLSFVITAIAFGIGQRIWQAVYLRYRLRWP
jgi:hypothetical protein